MAQVISKLSERISRFIIDQSFIGQDYRDSHNGKRLSDWVHGERAW